MKPRTLFVGKTFIYFNFQIVKYHLLFIAVFREICKWAALFRIGA